MREDAAKVNVPFVESMRPARRRQSLYSVRRVPFLRQEAAARNSSAGGGFSSAASAAPSVSVSNSSAAIGAALLRRHFGQGPTIAHRPAPIGARSLRDPGSGNPADAFALCQRQLQIPPGSRARRPSTTPPVRRYPPPRMDRSPSLAQLPLAASGAPRTSTASFTERPRRKCRCAAGSRWPTNR
jgi:hypothetical protein